MNVNAPTSRPRPEPIAVSVARKARETGLPIRLDPRGPAVLDVPGEPRLALYATARRGFAFEELDRAGRPLATHSRQKE